MGGVVVLSPGLAWVYPCLSLSLSPNTISRERKTAPKKNQEKKKKRENRQVEREKEGEGQGEKAVFHMASLPLGPQTHHHHLPPEHDPLKPPFRRPDHLDSDKVLHFPTSVSTSDLLRSTSLSFIFLNSHPISLFSLFLTRSRSEHCLRDSPLARFSDRGFLFFFFVKFFS